MNIPWAPVLPQHWGKTRAKNLFVKQNRAVRDQDDVVTCFRDGVVTLRKNRRITGFTESTQWSGYQGIRFGDLVIHIMDAFAGAIGVSDSDGKSTPVYNVCTAKSGDVNNYYYAYLLREMARAGYIQALYRGIRERSSDFRFEVFGDLLLPIPPREEQDQIVRYLDWKVSQINKLIHAKRCQIALLQDQRRNHIDTTMQNIYGETSRFRYLFSLQKGLSITKADLKDEGVPCVSYGEVHSKYGFEVNPEMHKLKFVDKDYLTSSPKALLEYGNFIFADTSEDIAGSGNFTYLNSHASVFAGYHTIIARSRKSLNYRYIAYYFDSSLFRSQIQREVNGVKVYSITRSILNRTTIKLSNDVEQANIVQQLDKQCSTVDRLISLTNNEINYFSEYRTRFISAAVTGHFDARSIMVPKCGMVYDAMCENTMLYDEDAESNFEEI